MAAAAAAAAPGGAGGTTATATTTSSRFAAACGALSQYVKAAERARARPAVRRPLPLMPGADVDAAPEGQEEAEAGQLTIVYGGRALVLDAVPADKAADLLRLAASAAARATAPRMSASGVRIHAADLPVSRRASLQRFMEKRKGRLAAREEPYLRSGARADRDDLTLAL